MAIVQGVDPRKRLRTQHTFWRTSGLRGQRQRQQQQQQKGGQDCTHALHGFMSSLVRHELQGCQDGVKQQTPPIFAHN